ncbi:MAG: LCP family protein [Terrabacter sp.]
MRRWLARGLLLSLVAGLVAAGVTWWTVRHLEHALTRVPMALDALEDRPADTAALDLLLVLTAPADEPGEPLEWAHAGPVASVMLMHLDADRRGVGLVALPTPLTSGPAEEGPLPLAAAVEQMTGVHLDHVAVLEWRAIADLVDASDGVEVELPGGIAGVEPGLRTLDAVHAWSFVRDYPGPLAGPPGASRRMQFLLRTVLEDSLHQEMARNPYQLARFLDHVAHGLVVDEGWQLREMVDEAWSMRRLRSFDIRFVVAPTNGTGTRLQPEDSAALWDALRGDTLDSWMGTHPGCETARRL